MEYDLADDWEEIDYLKVIKEKIGIDIINSTDAQMTEAIKKAGVKLTGEINRARLIDNCWKIVRKTIAGPAFLLNEPKFMSPLAKSKAEDPEITERFHIILAGSELGNGYSELNDPVDQRYRFEEQQKAREKGDEEAQMMDLDFVEMLSYGMPPTSGFGMSERLFWFMEDVSGREGTLFPPLRIKKD
jgi:lysyl-tRNA synthetase class 2